MAFEQIRVSAEGPIAWITLARPERRNALSLAMMREIITALGAVTDDAGVVVIAAEGPVFSAGHDLSEMVGREPAFYDELFAVCTELMLTLHALPQPAIAAVQGTATAAGCQLVAACDLAIAAETAQFATPGVKVGLFCSTPMVPLTRVIGRRRALQMLFTGTPIDARTALEWGLVNEVVAGDDLDDAVEALAHTVLQFSPRVVGLGKRAFYAQVDRDEVDAYRASSVVMAANAADDVAQEGFAAFLGKRPPDWDRA